MVAISVAQKALGTTSLEDCTIYVNAEPCAYCCYAIRESRIGRVVYGLRSPHMGGVSKWNVLADDGLSDTMPEVFAPPPLIRGGFMWQEAERTLEEWSPVAWAVMKRRGIFTKAATPGSPRARTASPARGAASVADGVPAPAFLRPFRPPAVGLICGLASCYSCRPRLAEYGVWVCRKSTFTTSRAARRSRSVRS